MLALALCVLASHTDRGIATAADGDGAIEKHQYAIGFKTDDLNRKESSISTCFLIRVGNRRFLVTASHVIERDATKTWLLASCIDTPSQSLLLPKEIRSEWKVIRGYDAVFLPLDILERHSVNTQSLDPLVIDSSNFLEVPPPRGTSIQYVGFPIGLGASPPVAALMISGSIASGEIATQKSPKTAPVVLCTPGAMAGMSGAPVFVKENGRHDVQLVGMVCAYIGDSTGAKLTKVVPALRMKRAIEIWMETQSVPLEDRS